MHFQACSSTCRWFLRDYASSAGENGRLERTSSICCIHQTYEQPPNALFERPSLVEVCLRTLPRNIRTSRLARKYDFVRSPRLLDGKLPLGQQ